MVNGVGIRRLVGSIKLRGDGATFLKSLLARVDFCVKANGRGVIRWLVLFVQ